MSNGNNNHLLLLQRFEDLDDIRRQIFWFYFLHLYTDGALGGSPQQAGLKFHYKVTTHWTDSITHGQFKYRAHRVAAPLATQFHQQGLEPPGAIPSFLIPLDGGRRPDVVTLANLHWVRNPRIPHIDELWPARDEWTINLQIEFVLNKVGKVKIHDRSL